MNRIMRYLEEHHVELKLQYVSLSMRVSTKIKNNVDTGVPCITFYVTKKQHQITESQRIPRTIDGIPTDVVELSATDYELGETSMSKLSPEKQRRRLGLKCPQ